jgi:hypothetical protein
MVTIPAICMNCGTAFPSGFGGKDGGTINVIGCISGPCPNCGADGRVPDGVYEFWDGLIKLIAGPAQTIADLKRLAALLEEIRAKKPAPTQAIETISEEFPQHA